MTTPTEMSDLLLRQAAQFNTLSDQLTDILRQKPTLWMQYRQEVASDTAAERKWSSTELGVQETVIRLKLRALEKHMGAIKARLRVLEVEARNGW